MKALLKFPVTILRFLVFVILIFGLPLAFIGLGASHIEIRCIKSPTPECETLEAIAFGFDPRSNIIKDVKEAKLKLGKYYYDLVLVGQNQSIVVNSYSNNAKIRNIKKIKKNINRFLKDDTQFSFDQKSTYFTPFFAIGFLFLIFSIWFMLSSVLIAMSPQRKQQVQNLMSKETDLKDIQNNLNLFYVPKLNHKTLGNLILSLALACTVGLTIDLFYFKNFDEITFLWIIVLVPTYRMIYWLKTNL